MLQKISLYTRFERFWHWLQALLIIILIITGLEIHGTLHYPGFEKVCLWHNICGWAILILSIFAIFWHFTTGNWKYYITGTGDLSIMIRYYLWGIMKGEPHPFSKSRDRKFNPLQAMAYLFLKLILLPLQILSGVLYYYYPFLASSKFFVQIDLIAAIHMAGAFLLLAFLIVHTYLTTTGGTILSYIKAMITGWEEVEC